MTAYVQPPGPLSRAEAKGLLNRAAQLRQSIAALDAGPDELREQTRAAFHTVREAMVARDLDGMPVERLNEATAGGLRVGALRRAGYTTVGRIAAATPARLQAVNGVGPTTANQAVAAARQLADAVRTNLQFRVDLDPGNVRSSELIAALYRADRFTTIADGLRQPGKQLAAGLDASVSEAAVAKNRLRNLFAGRKRRAAAQQALQRVAQLVDWADTSGLAAAVRYGQALLAPDSAVTDEAWQDFEKRSPEYYGRLGEIVDLGLRVDAAEGFLPSEIIERVNAQTLDDTFRRVSLRGYQAFGARFALVQKRVIVGDEMGLGKTIQAIAAMAHLRALDHKHFLVACPASVVVNWTREIAARSTLRAHRIHGTEREQSLKTWLRDGGVGVTTIDSLHNINVPDSVDVAMVIVDEAHYVKNPDARRSRSVKAWTQRVDRVLFLTGTPMENRVDEFRNLVDYLQPELAHSAQDRHGIAGPLVFRKTVAPVYLRRNQDDVLQELPELARIDEWVDFSRSDHAAYRSAVAAGNFMAMRRAAYQSGTHSTKLARLLELVDECAGNGRKVVIFSYFRDVLDLVASTLGPGVFGPLSGSTPAGQRQTLIDRFADADGHAVLVSQIQAGGVGLNMQAASVAILCEPQLKPTTEDQAVARLHRMGQVRAVQVHRLLATNSADERLLELLARKGRLFDEYARRSDIAEASPEAVDISDGELSRQIVEMEQERLALASLNTAAHE